MVRCFFVLPISSLVTAAWALTLAKPFSPGSIYDLFNQHRNIFLQRTPENLCSTVRKNRVQYSTHYAYEKYIAEEKSKQRQDDVERKSPTISIQPYSDKLVFPFSWLFASFIILQLTVILISSGVFIWRFFSVLVPVCLLCPVGASFYKAKTDCCLEKASPNP